MLRSHPIRHDDPRETTFRESVVVYLTDKTEADIASLAVELTEICTRTHLGTFAGTEQENTEAAIYFATSDAHTLLSALEPALFAHPDAANPRIKLATGFGAARVYNDFPLRRLPTRNEHDNNEWRGYRAVKRRLIILFIGWLPVVLLAIAILNYLFQSGKVSLAFVAAYAAAMVYTLLRLGLFKCPICGELLRPEFALIGNFYRKSCQNCDTPINPRFIPR